jgi:hypothetical protein
MVARAVELKVEASGKSLVWHSGAALLTLRPIGSG